MGDIFGKAAIGMIKNIPNIYGHTFCVFGDSISSANCIITATNTELQDNWYHRALWMAGAKYRHNAAIPGNTTTQMISRIDADVIALNPKPSICFILGGTNDLPGNAPISTTAGNIEGMIKKLLSAKIMPVLCSLTPRQAEYNARIVTCNLAYFILATRYQIPFIDLYTSLVDETDGKFPSTYTSDGLHPNSAGTKAMATLVYNQFLSKLPPTNPYFSSSADTGSLNMLANPLFLVDTNSDGTPDNWTKNGTGTCGLDTAEGIKGKVATLTATSSASATLVSDAVSTGWSVGDRINVHGLFKTAGLKSAGAQFYIYCAFNGAASVLVSPVRASSEDWDWSKFSLDFTVPTGCTSFTIRAWINNGGSGGGAVSLAQIGFINLTTSGVLSI